MNDHNLEDLIVEEIQPKSSTGKNILTILALLIIILFVAIFLMRTLLDIAPSIEEHNLTFEQNNSQKIDTELTLNNIVSLDNPNKANSNLSDIVEDAPSEPEAPEEQQTLIETNSTELNNTNSVKVHEDTVKEEEPLVEDESSTSTPSQEITETAIVPVIPPKPKNVKKRVHQTTQKVKESHKQASKQTYQKPTQQSKKTHYYIQVGSYRKHPSTEFLAIIRKTGFRYKVTPTNSRGIRQLLIGSYPNRSSANHALKQVQDRINKKAFVVKR